MITILTPIVSKNSILYPVTILNKLYNFKIDYDVDVELNTSIDGIVCMLCPVAICNNIKIQSTLPEAISKMHPSHTLALGRGGG